MGCTLGTQSVVLVGVGHAWQGLKTLTQLVGDLPYANYKNVIDTYVQPSRKRWIPGDSGYVRNNRWTPGPGRESQQGENIIYLGIGFGHGCFEKEEQAFLEQARFWAHGIGSPVSLPYVETIVNSWGEAELLTGRVYLRQPPAGQQ